jgi:hypothetical protein
MPSRRKLDWDRVNELQMIVCPHCTAKIGPEKCKRVDGERLKCPWCGETFVPRRQKEKPRRLRHAQKR